MGAVEGKVAFITGAARGQGRSHAVRLAAEGADIIAVDICAPIDCTNYPSATTDDLAETARLVEATGRGILTKVADVRDDQCPPAVFREVIDINLTGVFNTMVAGVKPMIEGGRGGSVILISSIMGLMSSGGIPAYTAAKHGLVGLMRSAAHELAPHRIRVNSIHPGNVRTTMIENDAMAQLFRPDLAAPTLEDTRDGFTSMNLLPEPWLEVSDITEAVVYLVGESGRFITGITLPVDQGAVVK
jgi:(+)-trans-carveol dehydrogenase